MKATISIFSHECEDLLTIFRWFVYGEESNYRMRIVFAAEEALISEERQSRNYLRNTDMKAKAIISANESEQSMSIFRWILHTEECISRLFIQHLFDMHLFIFEEQLARKYVCGAIVNEHESSLRQVCESQQALEFNVLFVYKLSLILCEESEIRWKVYVFFRVRGFAETFS